MNHDTTNEQEHNDTVTIRSEPVDVVVPQAPTVAQPPADEPKMDELAKDVEEPSAAVAPAESQHPAQEQHDVKNTIDAAHSEVDGASVTPLGDVPASAKSDNLLNFDDSEAS